MFFDSFGQAFSKACAEEGAEPSSSSAEDEIGFAAFLFASFFLAPISCKEKADKSFLPFVELCIPASQPDFSSQEKYCRIASGVIQARKWEAGGEVDG
ncbi:MAG: hypothetical protein IKJ35_08100 [Clostridia bacterium]|nr:hypothetical protein [Clostridia bacterium]